MLACFINGHKAERINHHLHSRKVFFYRDLIVKIDEYLTNEIMPVESQCYREWKFWLDVKDTPDAHFFAPVIQYGFVEGYRYVIMPKFEFLKESPDPFKDYRAVRGISRRLRISDLGTTGECGDNWGITRDGKMIIYDYGIKYVG